MSHTEHGVSDDSTFTKKFFNPCIPRAIPPKVSHFETAIFKRKKRKEYILSFLRFLFSALLRRVCPILPSSAHFAQSGKHVGARFDLHVLDLHLIPFGKHVEVYNRAAVSANKMAMRLYAAIVARCTVGQIHTFEQPFLGHSGEIAIHRRPPDKRRALP